MSRTTPKTVYGRIVLIEHRPDHGDILVTIDCPNRGVPSMTPLSMVAVRLTPTNWPIREGDKLEVASDRDDASWTPSRQGDCDPRPGGLFKFMLDRKAPILLKRQMVQAARPV